MIRFVPSGVMVLVLLAAGPALAQYQPRPSPYKPLFYDNDFRYLNDPANTQFDCFDVLKQIPVGCLTVDIGGEFRWQGKVENNRRLDGRNNTYNLFRERVYADVWYDRIFRVYVEGIDAVSNDEDQPPLATDENRSDLQNLFAEARLWTNGGQSLSFRYGRQELLYGAERLVSPLDWANTRRTFDEVAKLFWRSAGWDIDGFWSRPITADPHNFDHGDQSRQFGGLYAVCKSLPRQTLDFYFLTLLESDDIAAGGPGVLGDFEVYTFGTRWAGTCNDWLWEIETAYQFGHQADLDRSAGMFTAGVGRRFPCWPKPEIWFYYDWASGDRDPGDGRATTFNQLFPLGHKYFGILDLVGRQNIRDPNVLLTLTPHEKVKLTVWYHHFQLDEARDGLYNAAGVETRRDPTGQAGRRVGDEIDLILDLTLNQHAGLQFGYAHFTPGRFIKDTGPGGDAEFFYAQFLFRF